MAKVSNLPLANTGDPSLAPTTESRCGRRFSRLPPLNLFRVFDAAARCGSFTGAAAELCVTPSAVSQQIRQLEDFLEVRLFRRLPRRIELTREGTSLADVAHEALSMLSRVCERVIDPDVPSVLCVNAAPAIATRWLVPRLKRFMEQFPKIRITLLASYDPVDFDRQDIDVAIRWGNGHWPGVLATPLGREPIFPVCSPGLLESEGPLTDPHGLARHTLLQVVNSGYWTEWFEAAGVRAINFADTLYFNEPGLMLEAAAQGQGIGLASLLLVENDLKSGRLVRPFSTALETEEGFYLLSSPAFANKPAIVEFREWLRTEANEAIARS